MKQCNFSYLLIIFLSLLTGACKEGKEKQSMGEGDNGNIQIEVPSFNSDSAFQFVKVQTDFGPRVPNTEAHEQCAFYLLEQVHRFCDTAYIQSFDAIAYDKTILKSKNIVGSFLPEAQKRVLLGAHWDSRPMADYDPNPANRNKPIDGANDGASGVGVLLEIARQLHIKNPTIGIDIVFFDSEDYGTPASENLEGDWWALGSQYWAKKAYQNGYKADYGILLDMVGGQNATFYHEGFSSLYAPEVISKIWGKAYQFGYGSYFINESANPITDDHYYVNKYAYIKMINIIHQDKNSNTGFTSVWHTLDDNISNIDKQTLEAVGKTVLAVLYDEK